MSQTLQSFSEKRENQKKRKKKSKQRELEKQRTKGSLSLSIKEKSQNSTRKNKKRKSGKKKNRVTRKIRNVKEMILIIFIASLLFFGILSLLFSIGKIQGYNMMRTLRDGDVVVFRKTNRVKRFDIVAYKRGKYNREVQRVIGLPGEKIYYKDDTLYVNDQEVVENFIIEEINESQKNGRNFTKDFTLKDIVEGFEIPKDHYLVLGDNRPYSNDSREYGLIKKDTITGVVSARLFP